jgi:hypothetical protein
VKSRLSLRLPGAGLLAATGAIHLDLYLTGYRSIPTIGWLFLLQLIAAFGLAAAVLATASRLIAAACAGFALATLGGYLLSVWTGLFGFTEIRSTAGNSRRVDRDSGVRDVDGLRCHTRRARPVGRDSRPGLRAPG